jgi:hypothetical protein
MSTKYITPVLLKLIDNPSMSNIINDRRLIDYDYLINTTNFWPMKYILIPVL